MGLKSSFSPNDRDCFVVLTHFLLVMQSAIMFGLFTRLVSSTGDQVDRESLESTKFEIV